MTVTTNYAPMQYTANGSTAEFAITWTWTADADLRVYLDGALNTDYTVNAASITFGSNPANGVVVTIARESDLRQDSVYAVYDSFPSPVVEADFDLATIERQELSDAVGRSIRHPDWHPGLPGFVIPSTGAGKLFGLDSSNNVTMVDTSFITSALSSAATEVVNNYTAARALTLNDNDMVLVVNPGQTGVFLYDASDTAADNGGTILEAGPGAMRRMYTGLDQATWYGCVSNGVDDDLANLDLAIAGALYGVELNVFGTGVYEVSDNVIVRRSDFLVKIPVGSHLRCQVETTTGATLAIAEGVAYGGSDTAQLSNVHVFGGGKVSAQWGDAGSVENAIGFSRVDNFSCVGMEIPACDWKGITAQGRCTNGRIANNNVLDAGKYGISVETVPTINYHNNDITIENNYVANNSGETGIHHADGNGSYETYRLRVTGNRSLGSNTIDSFSFSGVIDLEVAHNIANGATGRGFYYLNCQSITRVGNQVRNVGGAHFHTSGAAGYNTSMLEQAISPAAGQVGFISENDTVRTVLHSPRVSGATHDYAVWQLGSASYMQIVDDSQLVDGTLGFYNGNRPDRVTHPEGKPRNQALAWAASVTPDFALGSMVYLATITGATTINTPTNMRAGETMRIRLVQNAGGGHVVTFSGYKFGGVDTHGTSEAIALDTSLNTVSLVELEFDGANYRTWVVYTGQAL